MKAIWPKIVVEENNLNQNISALRRALGERPWEHRFIVTEPGRGYRFVADVTTRTAAQSASTVTEAVATKPTGSTIADVGPRLASTQLDRGAAVRRPHRRRDQEYFSDGLAEELIHTLARVPGLRVPARTSSFAYKAGTATCARSRAISTWSWCSRAACAVPASASVSPRS